jgi:hypothetical protein
MSTALRSALKKGYPLATLADSGVMPCVPRRPSAPDTLASIHRSSHGANDAAPRAAEVGPPSEIDRTLAACAPYLRGQLSLSFAAAWEDSPEERARRAALFDRILSRRATADRGAWTSAAVARRLGVAESAVRWWRTGGRPVTDEVVERLGLGAEWLGGVGASR